MSILSTDARIVDNYDDNVITGWTEYFLKPGLGAVTEAGGRMKISLPATDEFLLAGIRNKGALLLQEDRILELRVDLISSSGSACYVGLGWAPNTLTLTNFYGYSLVKSQDAIMIAKGRGMYFYKASPALPIKNDNITLVLTLTIKGHVIINAKILDKADNNKVLFEQTCIDTIGEDALAEGTEERKHIFDGPGNMVLFNFAEGQPDAFAEYEAIFDNAEVYVLDKINLDDFNDNVKSNWEDLSLPLGMGQATETGGQFKLDIPAAEESVFISSTKTWPPLEVRDGERLELRADVISANDDNAAAVLYWVPYGQWLGDSGYCFGKSATDIFIGKGWRNYFYRTSTPPEIRNNPVTLQLSLTGKGNDVIINAKVYDKQNDNAIVFDQTCVDTPASDAFMQGIDDPAPPFTGSGRFVLMCYPKYEPGGPATYSVTFDNANACAPPPSDNTPPRISIFNPIENDNFVTYNDPRGIMILVTDDKPIPMDFLGLSWITLNNQPPVYHGSYFSEASDYTMVYFYFSPQLMPNTIYEAEVHVLDSHGVPASKTFTFATFSTNYPVIELEDYNFGGGQFIDSPVVLPEWSAVQADSYLGQIGVPSIDFDIEGTLPANSTYRSDDPVIIEKSQDYLRPRYVEAGGPLNGVFDYDLIGLKPDAYLNYTRTFPPDGYEVYLRQSLCNVASAEAILEKVTSDPTQPNQTTSVLGWFISQESGPQYRNVLLTDALGQQKAIVRLDGIETIRLRQVSSEPSDGYIGQNYLLFVPTVDPRFQRASIIEISPAPNEVVGTLPAGFRVRIENRETSVNTNSIKVVFNGYIVTPTITSDESGATVTYTSPQFVPGLYTNRVWFSYTDEQDVVQTTNWIFVLSYATLSSVNRQQGYGINPGFIVRAVQAPQGADLENSLARAEEQVALASAIPAFYRTNVIAGLINFSQDGPGTDDGYFPDDAPIPGLNPIANGADNIAMEIRACLELHVGAHRFGVRCDDGYRLICGSGPAEPNAKVIAFNDGGPADDILDFLVLQTGLYPFRLIWYEQDGPAHLEWFSVNTETGLRTLINDPTNTNAVPAYSMAADIRLESSANLTGLYAWDPSALVDPKSNTITVSQISQNRFYRLRFSGVLPPSTVVKITDVKIDNYKVVLSYMATAELQ